VDQLLAVSVDCYSGYRGDETPVRLRLGSRIVAVDEVLDRWLAPDHRYFKLRTSEGIYIVRHDVESGGWELTMFERGERSSMNQASQAQADDQKY
jgi:hypothetical protein